MQDCKETGVTLTTKEELDNLYKDIQASLITQEIRETKEYNTQQ